MEVPNAVNNYPPLSLGFIEKFLNENQIGSNAYFEPVKIIQQTYVSILQQRASAYEKQQLTFRYETQLDCANPSNETILKIFEKEFFLSMKFKEKEERTSITLNQGQWNNSFCKDFKEGPPTLPSEYFGQKFLSRPLNSLDIKIYDVIKDTEIECDDDCYLRVYGALVKMVKVVQRKDFSLFITNLKTDDNKLLWGVMNAALGCGIVFRFAHTTVQNVCFKGDVDEPSLMGNNEMLMPVKPAKIKRKLDPTYKPDINFICQGVTIPMHKVVLAKVDYFKDFLDNLSETSIPRDDFTPRAIKELRNFLYNDAVSQECRESIEISLEVFKLAHEYLMDDLEYIAKKTIFNKINASNFILVLNCAENEQNEYLLKLCKEYAGKYTNLGNEIDFTNNTAFQLFQFQLLLSKYRLKSLDKTVMDELRKKFELNSDFVEICKHVVDSRNDDKEKLLDNLLTKEFVENLKKNKDNYKVEWEAYVNYRL